MRKDPCDQIKNCYYGPSYFVNLGSDKENGKISGAIDMDLRGIFRKFPLAVSQDLTAGTEFIQI